MAHDPALALRSALRTDIGRQRHRNEDTGYASARLLAIADGMGGHAAGDVASATAIEVLAELDGRAGPLRHGVPPDARFPLLADAVREIGVRLAARVGVDPDLTGMGTTVTAMYWDGREFAVAHIGDSRGYLLRDGTLRQLTTDHTLVQSLVEDGKLSSEQAATHPRRSMLMRAVQGGGTAEPDLFDWPVLPGDRYLLCSDGLSDYVPGEEIEAALCAVPDPGRAGERLIELANHAGGADNVTCVVADLVPVSWFRRLRSG